MDPNWRSLAIIVLVFLVISVLVYAVMTRPDDGNNGPAPDKAPTFSLVTIDGEAISLDQFKGKVVVLDLMATWCGPCATQMDELNQLRAKYSESQVVIISIDVDTQETTQQLREFKEDHVANWRFARDTDGVSSKYGASNIPTLAVIDKDGGLQWKEAGLTTFEDLKDKIEPLL